MTFTTCIFNIFLEKKHAFSDVTEAIADSFGKEFKWVNKIKAQKKFKEIDLDNDQNVFIGIVLFKKKAIKIHVLEYDLNYNQEDEIEIENEYDD
jgi:hypothetical protein